MKPAEEVVEDLVRQQAATGGTSAELMVAAIEAARREGAGDFRERAAQFAERSTDKDIGEVIRTLPLEPDEH